MAVAIRNHGVTAFGPLHEALACVRGWRAVLVAAFLGAFSTLAFAPFHATPVLLVSLVGLVWMIDGARGIRRWGRAVFARGWAFGFGYFLSSMHWTASPFLVEPEKHAIFIWMPLVLLPGGMALIWGAVLAMAAAFWSASPSRVFVFAFFFAIGEWIRGHLFGGFPWNLAGTSWIPGGAISQAASLGGVYWLTLLTVFACAAPAALVDTRDARGLGARFLPALIAVGLISALWAWGAQRISEPARLTDQSVVLMDVGVPQSLKYQDGQANPEVLRRYLELLSELPRETGDIVIWPEGATGGYLLSDRALEPVAAFLGERTLIAGTVRYTSGSQGEAWYNSLAVLTGDSARTGATGLYDKHRLVPVGELPVARILPFGQYISGILPGALQRLATSGFEPGVGPAIVYGDGLPAFVANICYEALYPGVVRSAQTRAGHRADWIVVISNDGWFGALIGPAQHYAQNRYRAIEAGLPMARVASRGTSAMIDGRGREVFRAGALREDLPGWSARYGRTYLPEPEALPLFQTRAGQMVFPVTLLLLALLAFFTWRR